MFCWRVCLGILWLSHIKDWIAKDCNQKDLAAGLSCVLNANSLEKTPYQWCESRSNTQLGKRWAYKPEPGNWEWERKKGTMGRRVQCSIARKENEALQMLKNWISVEEEKASCGNETLLAAIKKDVTKMTRAGRVSAGESNSWRNLKIKLLTCHSQKNPSISVSFFLKTAKKPHSLEAKCFIPTLLLIVCIHKKIGRGMEHDCEILGDSTYEKQDRSLARDKG